MNYNNQFYMQELQGMKDRIDSQMRQMQQQNQMQQPIPQINQSFQLAPNNNLELQAKYVTNINDVKNTFVMNTGIFVNRDMSTMWLKSTDGEIKTFNLTEIIEEDEKDKEIDNLKNQIQELKGMILNATKCDNANDVKQVTTKKSETISRNKPTNEK